MATTIGVKMQMDGAAQFKADLQQITQKSKELAAEMKAAAAGADDEAKKQKILAAQIDNAKQKIDQLNKKYDAQKKALDDSNAELEAAKKAYGEDSDEVQKLTLAVTKQETALSKTKTEINKATAELNRFESQENATEQETRQLTNSTEGMKEGFTVLKGAMANLVADGIRKVVDGFKDLMTAGPAFGDQIMTLASKTHLATDTLQELSYMSGLIDTDVSTVAGSMQKLTKNMNSARGGSGAAADAFAALGISVTDVNGNLRDNEAVFFDAIEALGRIENETERDATAMAIFGKSATELNPMIEAGADQLRAFAKEAHDMGYVLDSSSLQALGRVQDEFDRFGKMMESVKNQIAAGLAPAMERGMKRIQEIVQKIDWKKIGQQLGNAFNKLIDAFEWILDHGAELKALLSGVIAALAVQKVAQFVGALKTMVTALKAATIAQEGMNAAANANPYVLLATAIVGCGVALMSWQKSLAEAKRAADPAWQATDRLTESAQNQIAVVNDMVDAYNSAREARDANVSSGMAEIAHVQTLSNELATLADENGVVTDANKTRAEFILNELNKALGTEYTMTGNQIDQYQTLSGTIDEVLRQKQAEIILAAQEEAYAAAITGRDAAEQALYQTETERLATETQIAENQARMNEIWAMSGQELAAHAGELYDLEMQNRTLETSLADLNTAYEEQAAVVDQYAYDVVAYETNMANALEGNYDQIEYKSWEAAKAQGQASSSASKAVSDNARQASSNWISSFANLVSQATGQNVQFQDVGKGMIQAYVDGQKAGEPMTLAQLTAMRNQMKNKMGETKTDAQTSGTQIPAGVASGIYSGSGAAFTAVSWLAQQTIAKFNQEMAIKSPSKVFMESGKYMVAGIAKGIEDNAGLAMDAVSGLSGSLASAMTVSAAAGAAVGSSVVNDSRQNHIVLNVYGTDGQNINDLADVVIDKLQRTITGSEAVYA